MTMLDTMLDSRVDAMKPHAARVGDVAVKYAERIVARLDSIHDTLSRRDFNETRRVMSFQCSSGGIAGTVPLQEIAQIPTDQEWLLENVTRSGPTVGGNVLSHQAYMGIFTGANGTSIAPGGVPRWNRPAEATQSNPGNGVLFQGGEVLSLAVYNNTPADCVVTLQFKVKTRPPVKRATTAGDRDPAPDALNTEDTTSRHGQHRPGVHVAGHRPI